MYIVANTAESRGVAFCQPVMFRPNGTMAQLSHGITMRISLACFTALLLTAATSAGGQDPSYESEIRALTERPEIQAAFRAVVALEAQTQSDLVTLTEIPAPPFMEEERARHYVSMLAEAGVDTVYIDEVGNVIGRRRGTRGDRTVALAGHMDTVFPEGTDVTVRQRGDTLFAPGVGDDTRGMTVVLTVLRALNDANVRTEADLLFIGTVGEEGLGDLRGVKHLFSENGPGIDSWIAIDGGGIGGIVNGGLGSHRYRVTFEGPGGHSWGAFGLANPSHALGTAVSMFDSAAREFVATGPRTSYNVGRIGGGTSVNSIPFSVWMEVDMRSESPERLDGIDSIFQASVRRAVDEQNATRRHGNPVTVVVEMIGDRPSGTTDPNTPLVSRAAASARLFGSEPRFGISSTDSNIPIALGVPAITIGRGGAGGGGHSLREWWLNKDGHVAIQNALTIAVAEAHLSAIVP
jgi:acetylornithine deacetylase/succinyl-diaminopimelate desuccinylase-like protein